MIDVFAGNGIKVEAGESVTFSGTFTRPEGLDSLTFRWNFGDGSRPVEGILEAGVTFAEASHTYANDRPTPYTATLVVSGASEVGEVEGRSSLSVRVVENRGWLITDWNLGDAFKDGVQILSWVGVYGVRGLVWAVALSPVWILLAVLVFGVRRWRRRLA